MGCPSFASVHRPVLRIRRLLLLLLLLLLLRLRLGIGLELAGISVPFALLLLPVGLLGVPVLVGLLRLRWIRVDSLREEVV